MNRYFLKVNSEQHCVTGFGKSQDRSDWDGSEIMLPSSGPVLAREGKRVPAPDIQPGDELWVWTHESQAHGKGRGLSAKATAAAIRDTSEGKNVTLRDVEIVPRHLGYKTLPMNDANRIESGSRLVDYTYTQTGYAVYFIEDDDYPDFMSLVERRGWNMLEEDVVSGEFTWRSEIKKHENEILANLTERRLSSQKLRPVQGAFRDNLFDLYGGKCLLTQCAVPEALEAAHVLPHTGDEIRDRPDNGLLLRRDLHTMFDAMLWSIDPKTNKVQLARRLSDNCYSALESKVINHHIDPDALLFHFKQFQKADKNV